ncbi:hypothetical protein [Streptomyces sp. CL12-4]|uniref:hypothetical protein n=1 Tax=Streptomyces sp. CL12-4 TaxID=2810306 RepID=UPI001EFA63B6|nr:hypothetical protein [Streptomyces sp. CL12-4]MCG8971825.1 hypothetical protein [Streptomyces sp. CL12-4]
MQTTTATPHAQAGQRARVIAEIARDRFAPPATLPILQTIAAHLETAAHYLETDTPGDLSSITVEVTEALWLADMLAEDNPATRFPVDFTNYVLHQLTGRPLPFPAPLNPLSSTLAEREASVTGRLQHLHDDTTAQANHPAEWLRAVLALWQKHMRLADEVRADNGRPDNQR